MTSTTPGRAVRLHVSRRTLVTWQVTVPSSSARRVRPARGIRRCVFPSPQTVAVSLAHRRSHAVYDARSARSGCLGTVIARQLFCDALLGLMEGLRWQTLTFVAIERILQPRASWFAVPTRAI